MILSMHNSLVREYTEFRKKHPLTFCSVCPKIMCRFTLKLQRIHLRNYWFRQCRTRYSSLCSQWCNYDVTFTFIASKMSERRYPSLRLPAGLYTRVAQCVLLNLRQSINHKRYSNWMSRFCHQTVTECDSTVHTCVKEKGKYRLNYGVK